MTAEKQAQKKQQEIARLEREKAKPKPKGYFWYFIFVIAIVYIADELATQINTQMQSVVASQLFAPIVGSDVADRKSVV